MYGKHIVELGAGCGGLPSIVSARAGAASVVVSDGEPSTLPLLRQNVASNSDGSTCQMHVRKLRWGTEDIPAAEVILGADVVWGGGGGSSCSQRTLLDTLSHAVRVSPSTVIIISYCPRYKSEAHFWEQASTTFHITAFRRRSYDVKDAGRDSQRDGCDGNKSDQCGGVDNGGVSGGVGGSGVLRDGCGRGSDSQDPTHLCAPKEQQDQDPRESATPAAAWSKCNKAEWGRAGGICIFRLTPRVPASVVRGRASGGGSFDKNVLAPQRVDGGGIAPATPCPGEIEETRFRNFPSRVDCSGIGSVQHIGGGSDGSDCSDDSDGSGSRSQEELLSDDSLLEAGGPGFDLDDLINPLDARE